MMLILVLVYIVNHFFKSKCVISHVIFDFSDIKIFYLVKLNGGRQIQGILRGFDPFMNLVVDECIEETKLGERNQIGMVVGF